MGLLTFAVLAFGNIGICLNSISAAVGSGAIDIAVMVINDEHAPQATVRSTIFKRALCWLAIGILISLIRSFQWASFDQKKHEESDWQLEPLLFFSAYGFGCRFGFQLCDMMRAHRDRRPTVISWSFLGNCCAWLAQFGRYLPYPQISALANALLVLVTTAGIYIVVMHIDIKAEQKDVLGDYVILIGISLWGIQANTLFITGLKDGLGSFVVSCALMAWQKIALKIIIPASKKCFGEDQRKLWSYVIPAFMLALELGPCLLLLGEDFTGWQF